jgi:hypothetical protein
MLLPGCLLQKGTDLAGFLRNVVQRNRVFHFRRAVPRDLRRRFQRSELTCSLRTSELRVAELLSRQLYLASEAQTERLSIRTVKRHFSALSSLWDESIPKGAATNKIFSRFKFPALKRARISGRGGGAAISPCCSRRRVRTLSVAALFDCLQ